MTERFARAAAAFSAMAIAISRSKAVMTALVLMGEAEIAAVKQTLPAEEIAPVINRVIEVYNLECKRARADLDSSQERFFEGLRLDDLTEGARRFLAEQAPEVYRQLSTQAIFGECSPPNWSPLPPAEPEFIPPRGVHIAGAMYHTCAMYRWRLKVLDAARCGVLAPDWRSSLTAETLHGGPRPPECSTQISDAEDLALCELVAEPPRPWEPGHAPGLRAALEAWYKDALDNEAKYGPSAIADHINTVLTRYGHERIPSRAGRGHIETMTALRRALLDSAYALDAGDQLSAEDDHPAYQAANTGRTRAWLHTRYAELPDYWK